MNKFLKLFFIFVVNLVLIIVLLIIIDYFVAKRDYDNYINFIKMSNYKGTDQVKFRSFSYDLSFRVFNAPSDFITYTERRRIMNPDAGQRSIMFFGCSYAYGDFLETEQTIGYKVSALTDRPVYNFAGSGWGLQHMYIQLEKKNAIFDQIKNPEYAIYIFMGDHIHRIYYHKWGLAKGGLQLGYSAKNNKLVKSVPLFVHLNRLNILKIIEEKYLFANYTYNSKRQDENFDLMKLYFIESRKKLLEKYPDIKFVILKYPYPHSKQWYYETSRWDELEAQGFIIVDLDELTKKNLLSDDYRLPDEHPNEKAWDLISQLLVKKLAL